jgi:hypothetical protein
MIDIQIQLTPKKTEIIKSFIEFTMEELGIKTTPKVIIQATRDGLETTAAYSPSGKWIKVYGTGRAMVDICRSIAHEAVHHKQNETGELEATLQQKGEIADIGEKIEDDANAIAGQLIKKFAKRKSKAIYETVEKKPISVDKFVKLFIDRCKKKGDVSLSELTLLGVWKRFENEEEEFVEKMTQAVFDFILEEQGDVTYSLFFKNGELADLFNTHERYDPEEDFEDILTYNKIPSKTGLLLWDDYIYDALNEKSREMLRRYSKVDHISSTYLEHEFPDLCHDIAHAYSKASDEYNLKATQLYIVKSIRNIFEGCQILKTKKGSREGFEITMPLRFMMTSTAFREKLQETIRSWVSVSTMKDGNLRGIRSITSTKSIVDKLFHEIGENSLDSFFSPIQRFFEEWAGGDLPKIDLTNGMGTGVDEDYFNQLVVSTIIKFFDERY